jgi:hypothetical protein
MWSIMGICILMTLMSYHITNKSNFVALIVSLSIVFTIITNTIQSVNNVHQLYESENIRIALQFIPNNPKPIVVADHHAYMENWFYSPSQIRERLVYPISVELETRYTGIDTGPRLLKSLRRRTTINAPDYEDFIKNNPHFILATNKSEWLVFHLQRSGYKLTPIFNNFNTIFYDVQRI